MKNLLLYLLMYKVNTTFLIMINVYLKKYDFKVIPQIQMDNYRMWSE